MNKVGIIEINSESINMVLAQTSEKGYFKIIDELKEYIDCGSDLISCSNIASEKLEKTIGILKVFTTMCSNAETSDILFITSEELESSHCKANIQKYIASSLDANFRVLSNKEALYYNYLAVKNSMFIENSLLLDINGHSTNIGIIENNILTSSATLEFGFIDISNKFNLNDNSDFLSLAKLKAYIDQELEKISWLKGQTFNSIIGVGNSIIALGKLDRIKKHYPINISHGYILNVDDIKEIYNLLKSKDLIKRKQISGMKAELVNTILASTTLLKSIASYTKIYDIEICGNGLREGLLFDYMESHFETQKDIINSSLIGVMDTLNIDTRHAFQVFKLSEKLFNQLEPIHKLKDNKFKRILKVASLLHDSGTSIRYYNHHLHSFYIILNSQINGLSHKELLMSAAATAMHRHTQFNIPLVKYSSILNKLDAQHIAYIGMILQIAEGLDRSLCNAIDDLEINITNETIELKLYATKNIDLEIREVFKGKNNFEEVYRKELVVLN
ncbi:MAG: Ppx/GppA phosphatase family protein [Sarcina sp.]